VATMLLGSYKVTPNLAPLVRLGWVQNTAPGAAPDGQSFINPLVGVTYARPAGPIRLAATIAATIPVGNGLDPKNLIGPLSNRMQLDKVMGYVADARARGAKVVLGGERREEPGYFYPLTVIAEATDEMRVVSEEQFGPVIPIIKYRSVEEAMRRANSLEVGLGGSVWGNDPQEAARYARQLECGTAWVNQHGALHPLAPFGGVKSSGLGVEFNVDGLKEYTTIQVVNVAR